MSSRAQPHHLALDAQALREAVEAHQRYLAGRSGGRRLSLTYADLSNCTLEGLDLREADFAGANFHGATTGRARFVGMYFDNKTVFPNGRTISCTMAPCTLNAKQWRAARR